MILYWCFFLIFFDKWCLPGRHWDFHIPNLDGRKKRSVLHMWAAKAAGMYRLSSEDRDMLSELNNPQYTGKKTVIMLTPSSKRLQFCVGTILTKRLAFLAISVWALKFVL